jgi:hypothetical protein
MRGSASKGHASIGARVARALGSSAAIGVAVLSSSGSARAQDPDSDAEPTPFRMTQSAGNTPAPHHALEAIVEVGYVHPVGGGSSGDDLQSSVGGGLDLGVGLGYRMSPSWSVDLRGQFHDSQSRASGATGDAHGFAIVAGPTLHLLPYELVDPYISLGAGCRALTETPGGVDAHPVTTGLDVVRLQVGMDLRTTTSIAVSLYVAGDVTAFLWGSSGSSFGPPSVSAFLSAGAQGRFDFGGVREKRAVVVASR